MIKMRKFEKNDYYAFAGVEGDDPLMSVGGVCYREGDEICTGLAVLDDDGLGLHLQDRLGTDVTFYREFCGRVVGERILALMVSPFGPADVEAFGFARIDGPPDGRDRSAPATTTFAQDIDSALNNGTKPDAFTADGEGKVTVTTDPDDPYREIVQKCDSVVHTTQLTDEAVGQAADGSGSDYDMQAAARALVDEANELYAAINKVVDPEPDLSDSAGMAKEIARVADAGTTKKVVKVGDDIIVTVVVSKVGA